MIHPKRRLALLLLLALASCIRSPVDADEPRPNSTIRFATYNVSLFRPKAGDLTRELESGESQHARAVAAVIQRVRPDVLLVNELDHDEAGRNAILFRDKYLRIPQGAERALEYPYCFTAPVNTGVPSGLDLDRDGSTDGPADCFGYGTHPGQYGMAVYSRFPFEPAAVRTFQTFPWTDMSMSVAPVQADGSSYYPPDVWRRLRLSSKSHWDVPIEIPGGSEIHFLVMHPTPPVFDGPEDRNGRRNHDEIRFWADYLDPRTSTYHRDDRGRMGGLAAENLFVIAGDCNADPEDGQSFEHAIQQLLDHPRVLRVDAPRSEGALVAAERSGGENLGHRGPAATDTGDFPDDAPGNLRCDYVLPSTGLSVTGSGVFWPIPEAPEAAWVAYSDHRLVWIDVALP